MSNFSDSRNYREISEDWFDAKENLTGADFTGEQERQIEQDSGDPASTQGWFLTPSNSPSSLVCGGIALL